MIVDVNKDEITADDVGDAQALDDRLGFLVTSASGANGDGYGTVLGFGPEAELAGPFSRDPGITNPRGMSLDPSGALVYLNSGDDRILALNLHRDVVRDSGPLPGLDLGGGEFGPDVRYYVTMRRRGTIGAIPAALDEKAGFLLPEGSVPFPRGFGFGDDGRIYLSSGVAPSGEGGNTIVVFDRRVRPLRRVAHAAPGQRPRAEPP
jgi:DNA-binding beta-propeller fold protein YncE